MVVFNGSPCVSSSNVGYIHDPKESSVQGGARDEIVQGEAERSLGDAIVKLVGHCTIRLPVRYDS